jgi:hypothetical protein
MCWLVLLARYADWIYWLEMLAVLNGIGGHSGWLAMLAV